MQLRAAGMGERVSAEETATERFAAAYAALFPSLHGFIRFRVGDPHLAEDLTAHVFERALSRLATVREPDRLRAWLFTIARRAITDHYRSRRTDMPLATAEDFAHLWAESPETEALRREEQQRLAAYLAGLADREREVLGLKFAAALNNREIAAILRLSEANIGQIVHRAIVKLRQQFAEE
jgi:RNA polymerase sigma factor (sigma-70 family)